VFNQRERERERDVISAVVFNQKQRERERERERGDHCRGYTQNKTGGWKEAFFEKTFDGFVVVGLLVCWLSVGWLLHP